MLLATAAADTIGPDNPDNYENIYENIAYPSVA
jgi:hypothetical protein